jgi:predicted amidohydrolase
MKIGFVQFDPALGRVDENIERAVSIISGTRADLLVLPELFNTGYFFSSHEQVCSLAEPVPEGRTTRALIKISRERKTWIAAGLAEKSKDGIFNSSVLVSPSGDVVTYRKIHLFNEEKIWFKPGDLGFVTVDTGKCRLGMMVCFDWFFPESARTLALHGADIICHCANLVLPYCQDAMVTRCLENRVFAVTANRTGEDRAGDRVLKFTGMSQITGPGGEILYRAQTGSVETGVVEIDIAAARRKTINDYNDLFADRRPEFYK